jgi:hypothetical protein
MIEISEQRRCAAIAGRVVSAYGRDQVAKALYEAILAGLDLGPCQVPSMDDRDWIRGAIASPIHEATEVALVTLSRSLGRTLQQAPDGLLARIERAGR